MLTAGYWDTKYFQSPVLYNGRTIFISNGQIIHEARPYALDARNFVCYPDFALERIVKDEGIWFLPTAEEKAMACLAFVRKNIAYTPDKAQYGVGEMWQYPHETLALGRGDCEDGAILMVSLMRNAGVPAFRTKVAAGNVVVGPNAPLGGHAYPLFLREKDEQWVILDWCYYPNALDINSRLASQNEDRYKDVWFTFNDELSWSPKPIIVEKNIKTNKTTEMR